MRESPALRATVAAVLSVAERRALILAEMGDALDRGEIAAVVRCARILTGRGEDDAAESTGAGSGIDGITGGG
jgi:hypothetical protein